MASTTAATGRSGGSGTRDLSTDRGGGGGADRRWTVGHRLPSPWIGGSPAGRRPVAPGEHSTRTAASPPDPAPDAVTAAGYGSRPRRGAAYWTGRMDPRKGRAPVTNAVEVEGVTKRFGTPWRSMTCRSLSRPGRVLALLGPERRGKDHPHPRPDHTARCPTGRVRVAGFDVRQDATTIRVHDRAGGQFATVDELLTGRENLELVGLLYHLDKAEYRRRAHEALDRMTLHRRRATSRSRPTRAA